MMLEMALGQMHGLIVDNSGTKTNENTKVGISHEYGMGAKCF